MSEKDDDRDLLREIFATVPAALIVLDNHGRISRANASALQILGEEKLEGRPWYEVIKEVFRPRKDDGHEISTRDGKRLSVSTRPLSRGQLIQITDLTDTRTLQEKLSHMERLSSLGRMAASLAHQIRTPLSAAMLYAANLGNLNLPAAARGTFQKKLMSRLEALEAQISDILMYARSNTQTASRISMGPILSKVEANVGDKFQKGGIELMLAPPEEELEILGNETALTGALSNLVNNAAEAGARHILLECYPERDQVCIEVADDGPGIPEKLKGKIFEPFFTTKTNGTGLGLAVVGAVVKVHQGTLELSSDEEYATIFTIRLPRLSEAAGGGAEVAP